MPDRQPSDADFERRLGQRLRAYESRIPDAEPPPPGTAPARAGRWLWLVGGGVAVVTAALLAVVFLKPPAHDPVGGATFTASASIAPTTEETSSATAGATAPPASSAPVQTPQPTPGPISRWAPVGVFASDGWAEEVTDMTYAAGHFIAIGYREPDDQRGHVGPPIDEPRIWISADGRAWEGIELGPAFASGHPRTIVALPDGSAVAYGTIDPDPPANPQSAAWVTVDGRTWALLDLALPREEYLSRVVGGPHGLITVVGSEGDDESSVAEVWHSIDGATWSTVHAVERRDGYESGGYDWGAGPEGFVVTGYRYRLDSERSDEQTFVVASGDGVEWFEAPAEEITFSTYANVAPVGGDWVIAANILTAEGFTGRAATWYSANGLAWDERTAIDVPMPTSPYPDSSTATLIGSLVSTGERVIASGSVSICCHGPWWAAGVWSSFDGRSWERLGFPDGTVVTAAAEHDGVVVLAGFDRARPEDEFKARATFWIGERE